MTDAKKAEESKAADDKAAPGTEVSAAAGTSVANTAGTDLAVAGEMTMEEMLLADAGAGSEFIGMNERVIPFVTILQNTSPQVAKGGPEQIKGAESSCFMNTLTKKITHGNVAEPEKGQGILFIPTHFKVKPIEWYRRDASGGGGGLVRIWGDDDSYKKNGLFVFDAKRNRFVNNETNSEISDHYETYGIWAGDFGKSKEEGKPSTLEELMELLTFDPMPCVMSMKGSQIKKSRAWNSERLMRRMMVAGRTLSAPAFFDAWRVQSKYEMNDQGNWFGYIPTRFTPPGIEQAASTTLALPNGKELYMMARDMSSDIQKGLITVDDSQLAGAEPAAGFSDVEVPF